MGTKRQSADEGRTNGLSSSSSSTSQPKPKTPLAEFQYMNRSITHPSNFSPKSYYYLNIVSTSFLMRWKKSGKVPDEKVNEEFIHTNPLNLPIKLFVEKLNYPLKNNIDLDDEFEAVSTDAWNFLMTLVQGISIRRTLYFDGHSFSEDRVLSINLIIRKGEEVETALVVEEVSSSFKGWFESVARKLGFNQNGFKLYFLETQRPFDQVVESVKAGEARGREVTNFKSHFNLSYIKERDFLLIVDQPNSFQVKDSDFEGDAICHNCLSVSKALFSCCCKLTSYCSFDCKAEDYLKHRRLCSSKFEELPSDLENDLKLQKKSSNKGEVGLINVGNFCYGNAIIQILKFNPTVKTFQEEWQERNHASGFWHSVKSLWQASREDKLKPFGFKLCLGLNSSQFIDFCQQDSHDALITLLNILDEADPNSKKVSDAFRGEFKSKIACDQCDSVITTSEPFLTFSLPIASQPKFLDFYPLVMKRSCIYRAERTSVVIEGDESDFVRFKESLISKGFQLDGKTLIAVFEKNKFISIRLDSIKDLYEELSKGSNRELHVQNLAESDNCLLVLKLSEPISKICEEGKLECKMETSRILPFNYGKDKTFSKTEANLLFFKSLSHLSEELSSLSKICEEELPYLWKNAKQSQGNMEIEENEETISARTTLVNLLGMNPWTIKFVNKGGVCPSCSNEGEHTCEISEDLSLAQFNLKNPVEIHVEVGSTLLLQLIKLSLESEKEDFSGLRVPPRPLASVAGCIDAFSEAQTIEFECPKCKHESSQITTTISKPPEMLVIQLKRFLTIQKENRFIHKKNTEIVTWETSLMVSGSEFQLFGVVDHIGELNSGHYTCFVRDIDGDRWLRFDDRDVEEVTDVTDLRSSLNYLLFFRRTDISQ